VTPGTSPTFGALIAGCARALTGRSTYAQRDTWSTPLSWTGVGETSAIAAATTASAPMDQPVKAGETAPAPPLTVTVAESTLFWGVGSRRE